MSAANCNPAVAPDKVFVWCKFSGLELRWRWWTGCMEFSEFRSQHSCLWLEFFVRGGERSESESWRWRDSCLWLEFFVQGGDRSESESWWWEDSCLRLEEFFIRGGERSESESWRRQDSCLRLEEFFIRGGEWSESESRRWLDSCLWLEFFVRGGEWSESESWRWLLVFNVDWFSALIGDRSASESRFWLINFHCLLWRNLSSSLTCWGRSSMNSATAGLSSPMSSSSVLLMFCGSNVLKSTSSSNIFTLTKSRHICIICKLEKYRILSLQCFDDVGWVTDEKSIQCTNSQKFTFWTSQLILKNEVTNWVLAPPTPLIWS